MNAQQYIEQRLDDQIAWYDRKSQLNQKAYRCLKIFELTAAGAIPVLVGQMKPDTPWHVLVGVLGAMIAVCSGVAGLFKFHELWIEYRTVTEALRNQKFLFLTGARPYHESNAFPVLVETIEGILAKENAGWRSINPPKREEQRAPSDEGSVAAVGA